MRNTACAALLLALLFNTGLALAGENETAAPGNGRNAALTYWRAFAFSPEMTKEDGNIIRLRPGPKVSPEKKAELVKEWEPALRLMHEAVAIPQCDWGIDYEKDALDVQLPHLSKARELAMAAAFRATCFWEKGQRNDAAGDIRAALIMGRQVGNDGRDTLIAMLVQLSIEQIVQRATAELLTDREAAEFFADVLGDFSKGSPALLAKNAILSEKKLDILWLRREIESQPDWKHILAERTDSGDTSASVKAALARLSQLQQGDALKLLDELGQQFDELADISAMPYLEFRAKDPALLEKIKASENPLSELFLSSLRHVRDEDEKGRIRWAMVRAAIEFRREGEKAFSEIMEPPDGKPFLYTVLEGGAFELKSAMQVREENIVMTFGQLPAVK
jgi:uncharacterized protein YheU (UPF0270 family)